MPVLFPVLAALALNAVTAAEPPPAPPPPRPAATPLDGIWRNMRDTVHIRAARCGPAVCGTVIAASAQAQADTQRGAGRSLIGMQLFRDFRPTGGGEWRGQIYIPDVDRNASGRILLTDRNSITVSGCMIAGLVCKTQHWKRVG